MKSSLLMLASVAFLSSPAWAQGEVAPDLLAPSGAWLVGPATLADGSDAEAGGMPCVMVNKFSNGSELRFSGGGEEILALALNVGAPSFEVNQSYLITIGFEGQAPINLPAEAFSEDTIVVGTEPGKDFYKFIKEKPSMTLHLGTSVMEFSLLGVPHSLRRLEECYKPLPASAAPVATPAAASTPSPNAAATGIKKLDEVSAQKVDELLGEITGNALPPAPTAATTTASAPTVPAPAAPVAAVSKSADVPVEEKAPSRSATPPQIQPAPAPLPEPKTATPAEPAPEPAPAAAPAPQPSFKDAKPRDILSPGAAAPVTGEGAQMRWRVMKGANLQSTLDVWAESTKGRLIWKADKPFSMPESMAMQGTFEAAVEAVLARFPRGQARPVGKIYTDPANGQKVLVIEQDSPALPASAEGSYAPIVSP